MGVVYVLLAEVFGVLAAEKLVQAFAGLGKAVCARNEQGVIGDMDDSFQVGHGIGIEFGPYHVADKEYFCLGMVHDVVHLLRFELMEDGYGHGTVAEDGKEGRRPVCAVSAAEGYLVAFDHAGVFKKYVQLFYFAGHILVLQGYSLIICQGIGIPVLFEAFGNKADKIGVLFHF